LTIKSTSHTHLNATFACAYIHLCLFVCPSNIQLSKIDCPEESRRQKTISCLLTSILF